MAGQTAKIVLDGMEGRAIPEYDDAGQGLREALRAVVSVFLERDQLDEE